MRFGGLALAAMALTACAGSEAFENSGAEARTFSGVPAEQARQIREAGQSMDPTLTNIFADLVDAPPYEDVTVVRDLAYGAAPAHRLDIYAGGDESGAARPVLLFVHGGGFVGGSKSGAFYPDNITAWAARNGMVGVNMNYRLAPQAPWPAARDDIAAAVRWIAGNIAEHGGDPNRVILWGHSAGANHVADYVQHVDLHGPEAERVLGAVLLSPFYGPAAVAEPHPYYGMDARLQTAGPAIERLGASEVPIFLAYAEFDPDQFQIFARTAEQRLCGAGAGDCPTVLFLRDHNHFTEGSSVGSVDQSLTGPLLEWMRSL